MLATAIKSLNQTAARFISTSQGVRAIMDPLQQAALKENCFLVNEQDKVIGIASKKECHQVQKDGHIPLHRAFSVFLFNEEGQLLLQKRSDEKVTYPGYYTNSCCSHPINDVGGEDEEKDILGILRAAVRRLNYELGIPLEEMPFEKFQYLTRIIYKDPGDGVWGEHEVDYILFMKANLSINPNPNEISEISFVPRDKLDEHIPALKAPLTPWFHLILKHKLKLWWDNLDNLEPYKDHNNVLKLV